MNCNYFDLFLSNFSHENQQEYLLIVSHTLFNLVLQLEAAHLSDGVNSQDDITECGIRLLHAVVEGNVAFAAQAREVKRFPWQVCVRFVVCFRRDEVFAIVVSLAALVDVVENPADGLVLRSSHIARPTIVSEHSDLEPKSFLIAVSYQHGFHVLEQIRSITGPLHRRKCFNEILEIIFASRALPSIHLRDGIKP